MARTIISALRLPSKKRQCFDLRDIACLIKHPSNPCFSSFTIQLPERLKWTTRRDRLRAQARLNLFAPTWLLGRSACEWLPLQLPIQSRPRNVPHAPRLGVTNRRRDGPRGSCPFFFSVLLVLPAGP